jgi:hypothetical protein
MASTPSEPWCTLKHRWSRALSRSQPRWVGHHSRSENCMSERIVEHAAPAGNIPLLTKTNYYDWAALMHVMLQARGLWDMVNEGMSDYTEDCMVVISKAMPVELMGLNTSKSSAMAAWEANIFCNVGVDQVRKAKASTLKCEFNSLIFNGGESVDDFGAHIDQTQTSWRSSGASTRRRRSSRSFCWCCH